MFAVFASLGVFAVLTVACQSADHARSTLKCAPATPVAAWLADSAGATASAHYRLPGDEGMTFRELDTVVLERDLPDYGLQRGDLGAVVHVHGEVLDVEFVRLSGQTQAVVQLTPSDVRAVRDADLPAVRTADIRRGAA
jgi:hypothetical protein